MANVDRSNPEFTNRLKLANSAASVLVSNVSYGDVAAMRTYLAASTGHGVGYYTAARLDGLTVNDMTYAVRLLQDPTTVK